MNKCIRCKAKYTRGVWDFYSLCDKCFAEFDYQKMEGRIKGKSPYYEDGFEWAKAFPVNSPDVALLLVDLKKFPTFTKVFAKAGQFCTRPSASQVDRIKSMFDDEVEDKPIVKIANAKITTGLNGNKVLSGEVIDHPRFAKGEGVMTSKILSIETRNTIYKLVENEDED